MVVKSFNNFVNEDDDIIGDLGSLGFDQYKGWVLCTQSVFDNEAGSSIWAVVAKNAGEAAVLIMENMGLDDEDDLETARKLAIRLRDDQDFYNECSITAKQNYNQHYNIETWKNKINLGL